MKLLLRELVLQIEEKESALYAHAAGKIGIAPEQIRDLEIVRRSLDLRKRRTPGVKYNVVVDVDGEDAASWIRRGAVVYDEPKEEPLFPGSEKLVGRPLVVGLGPCGLYAAYLLAKEGYRPLVVERGKPVEQRERDFAALTEQGMLDPESNVCFGEGGAGAFSDGKLTARSKDVRVRQVLELMVQHGAPEEIRYEARPHLGTENVRRVVSGLRREIERLGGEVWFESKLTALHTKDGAVRAATVLRGGASHRVETGAVLLAIGHSARDTFSMLEKAGVRLVPKPFAVGTRIEHPREMIDRQQFGKLAGHPRLGAAAYRLTAECGGRGVFSFCTCPGGIVVCSATEPEHTAVNGMSYYARDEENTNSAIVVSTRVSDFPAGALGGVELQRWMEARAYAAAGGYGAPAQAAQAFLGGTGRSAVKASYRPYTVETELSACMPSWTARALREGLMRFESVFPGFAKEGLLTGVETRTSSPVRVVRGEDGQSETVKGLYPAGEGAGYAGGIVSAAVDGLRAAEAVIRRFGRNGG